MAPASSLRAPRANSTLRLAVTAIGLLLVALVASPAAPGQNGSDAYDTEVRLSGGTDGTVWVTEIVGDQVWLGGTFSNVRDHAVHERTDVASQNLGVVDLNTGIVRTDRTYHFDGPVFAIEHHDDTIWVGGDFGSIDGQPFENLAAIDAFTGKLRPGLAGAPNRTVHDLLLHDGWMYAAGQFNRIGDVSTEAAARFDPSTGAVDASWQPTAASGHVEALAASDDLLVVGNYASRPLVYQLSDMSRAPARLGNGPGVFALDFSHDGTRIFGGHRGNFVRHARSYRVDGLRDGEVASIEWEIVFEGDAQAVEATEDALYIGFHDAFQGNASIKLVAVSPDSGTVLPWYVEIDSYWGVYAIQAIPQAVVVAGHFENVNGIEARRLAIFPTTDGALGPVEPLRPSGDVDCDAQQDIVDALFIVQFGVGNRTAVDHCPLGDHAVNIRADRADVDLDGRVSVVDALLIAQCSAGNPNEACAEPR